MDAALCREHLQQLLTDEAAALLRLEGLLDKEHRYIVSNDIESLDTAGAERQECLGALMQIEDERRALCRASGFGGDRVGLKQLLEWCDPDRKLHARWQESNVKIRHCRSLNDRNGALVSSRLKRVEGMLDILNGNSGKESRVYTPKGNAYTSPNIGRVFNAQV